MKKMLALIQRIDMLDNSLQVMKREKKRKEMSDRTNCQVSKKMKQKAIGCLEQRSCQEVY